MYVSSSTFPIQFIPSDWLKIRNFSIYPWFLVCFQLFLKRSNSLHIERKFENSKHRSGERCYLMCTLVTTFDGIYVIAHHPAFTAHTPLMRSHKYVCFVQMLWYDGNALSVSCCAIGVAMRKTTNNQMRWTPKQNNCDCAESTLSDGCRFMAKNSIIFWIKAK